MRRTKSQMHQEPCSPSLTASEALEFLGSDLISLLASLDGAPDTVCAVTLQLLPFGSRAALEAIGVVELADQGGQSARRSLSVTPFAFAVMNAAAAVAAAEDSGNIPEQTLAPLGQDDVNSLRGQQVLAEALASRLR